MSMTDAKPLRINGFRPTHLRRRGVGLLIGFGLVMVFWLTARLLRFDTIYLPTLCVSLGGWLLIFAAVSFARSDLEDAAFDGACSAVVGALTMGLLLAGWTSIGQSLVSVVSGGFLGLVVGISLGWTIRAVRSKIGRASNQSDPVPVNLHDPWIDP